MSETEKRLLDIHEAAAYLRLSPKTLYTEIAPKSKRPPRVKCKRVGRRVVFDLRDLDAYIDSL